MRDARGCSAQPSAPPRSTLFSHTAKNKVHQQGLPAHHGGTKAWEGGETAFTQLNSWRGQFGMVNSMESRPRCFVDGQAIPGFCRCRCWSGSGLSLLQQWLSSVLCVPSRTSESAIRHKACMKRGLRSHVPNGTELATGRRGSSRSVLVTFVALPAQIWLNSESEALSTPKESS